MRVTFVLCILVASCSAEGPQAVSEAADDVASETVPPPRAAARAPTAPPRHVAAAPRPSASRPTPGAPCPSEMVRVGRFCIDRYEAHLRLAAVGGIGPVHPYHEQLAEAERYVAVSRAGVFPQPYVSRVQAEAACTHAHKRLCSRTEWMLACRGTPAMPRRDGSRPCNHGKAHLLTLLFGGGYDYEAHFNSPQPTLTPGFLAKAAEYVDCVSEAGVHDMVGNLHEWVSDAATSTFLRALESDGVRRQFQYVQPGNAVFMGGFYSTRGELGPGCLFTTVAHDADYHDYSTGFRCCRDVDG